MHTLESIHHVYSLCFRVHVLAIVLIDPLLLAKEKANTKDILTIQTSSYHQTCINFSYFSMQYDHENLGCFPAKKETLVGFKEKTFP